MVYGNRTGDDHLRKANHGYDIITGAVIKVDDEILPEEKPSLRRTSVDSKLTSVSEPSFRDSDFFGYM